MKIIHNLKFEINKKEKSNYKTICFSYVIIILFICYIYQHEVVKNNINILNFILIRLNVFG